MSTPARSTAALAGLDEVGDRRRRDPALPTPASAWSPARWSATVGPGAGHRVDRSCRAQDLGALAHRGQPVVGQAVVGRRPAKPGAVVAHDDVVARARVAPLTDTDTDRGRGVLDGVLDGLAHDLVEEHLVVGGQRGRRLDVELDRDAVAALHLVGERAAARRRSPGRAAPTARGRRRARAVERITAALALAGGLEHAQSALSIAPLAGVLGDGVEHHRDAGHGLQRPVVQEERELAALVLLGREDAAGQLGPLGLAHPRLREQRLDPLRRAARSRRRSRRSRPGARRLGHLGGAEAGSARGAGTARGAPRSSSSRDERRGRARAVGPQAAAEGVVAAPGSATGCGAGLGRASRAGRSTTMSAIGPSAIPRGDGRAQAVGRRPSRHEEDGGVGPQQPVGLLGRRARARAPGRARRHRPPGCRPARPGTRPASISSRAACGASPRRLQAAGVAVDGPSSRRRAPARRPRRAAITAQRLGGARCAVAGEHDRRHGDREHGQPPACAIRSGAADARRGLGGANR